MRLLILNLSMRWRQVVRLISWPLPPEKELLLPVAQELGYQKTISRFFSPQQKPNISLTPVFEWNLETQAKTKIQTQLTSVEAQARFVQGVGRGKQVTGQASQSVCNHNMCWKYIFTRCKHDSQSRLSGPCFLNDRQ